MIDDFGKWLKEVRMTVLIQDDDAFTRGARAAREWCEKEWNLTDMFEHRVKILCDHQKSLEEIDAQQALLDECREWIGKWGGCSVDIVGRKDLLTKLKARQK